jgi:molecular chaperone GrpE
MASNPTDPDTGSQADAAAPADDLAAAEARIADLEKELAEARERADRYHSNWQRSAADFQNWKRRTDQEKTELGRTAEGGMALQLLSVIDDFERAFVSLPPDLRSLTWIEGVYLIGSKLFGMLQARGLSPIEAQGQEFDPHLHEAVLREEGAEGSDSLVVVQELQRGYRFHERVIRPTMVKVGPPPSTPASDPDEAATVPGEVADAVDSDDIPESSGESGQPVAS